MSDSAHTVWNLQRVALIRARRVIFSGILDLGGPPTCTEEERQLVEDARMADRMTRELRQLLATSGIDASFPAHQRDYWNARLPALLSFGARTHGEVVRLARHARRDSRATQAAAVFQLAASLLDWIGDEDGGATDVVLWVSPSTLERMARDAGARRGLATDARRGARPATAAFVTLLAALIELVRGLGGNTDRFFERLAVAYEAEIASFASRSSIDEHLAVAHLKSVAPTAVVGELARLTTTDDDRDVVEKSVSAIAGIFATIDDVADLSADLRTGAMNTLLATALPSGESRNDAGVAHAMQVVLATDLIEERSADVVASVHELARTLNDARVDPMASAAALEWLRTTTWRWIA